MRATFWLMVTWAAWPFYRYLGAGGKIVGIASGRYTQALMARELSR